MKEATKVEPSKQHVIVLGNERFSGPEMFFNPTDVGLQEGGLHHVIMQSVDAMPESIRAAMLANVVLVGGNVNMPGFTDRVYASFSLRVARGANHVLQEKRATATRAFRSQCARCFTIRVRSNFQAQTKIISTNTVIVLPSILGLVLHAWQATEMS
jgi:hypothetical protein